MKFSPRQNAQKRHKHATVITEHSLGDPQLDSVIAEIKGRYPETGSVTNQKCKLLAYVQAGQGKLVVEGKELNLNPGDQVLIEANEKYFWNGQLTLFISCSPAWYPEQHVLVES